jgi:hypothetical protein
MATQPCKALFWGVGFSPRGTLVPLVARVQQGWSGAEAPRGLKPTLRGDYK